VKSKAISLGVVISLYEVTLTRSVYRYGRVDRTVSTYISTLGFL